MGNAVRRNARYEAFLDNVPCLQQLGRYEKLKLTDALRSQSVAAGDAVVREGTYGNDFYIIEEGDVEVHIDRAAPPYARPETQQARRRDTIRGTTRVKTLSAGDIFGENETRRSRGAARKPPRCRRP